MSEYLIWSNEHHAWWRPEKAGYTFFIEVAGRYSRTEAMSICADARIGWTRGPLPEIPLLAADIEEMVAKRAVKEREWEAMNDAAQPKKRRGK